MNVDSIYTYLKYSLVMEEDGPNFLFMHTRNVVRKVKKMLNPITTKYPTLTGRGGPFSKKDSDRRSRQYE
jgi:hypothetical protein